LKVKPRVAPRIIHGEGETCNALHGDSQLGRRRKIALLPLAAFSLHIGAGPRVHWGGKPKPVARLAHLEEKEEETSRFAGSRAFS